ncbi:branched-chain amino acid transaminase [Spathaspora passalidarum NRRL Y-27907]|uniref:Branched-chain-amino-acid aminotransferase n=1 Tax=Spathaspora passalidarum (strain NRRL Y-27907 / 11-Y1) TaxID=619300 RepID=G3ALC5_SPAPN|nr:branched-chain amino acid transaminase [Spathaspora passalidarum NRRL Y-27907]EGW33167.1 branched-chain amino acid transaminase [Spathaspora passalidarum NRRL Y-27907]
MLLRTLLTNLRARSLPLAGSGMSIRFASTLAPLDSTKLTIEHTTTPKPKLAKEDLVFGKYFTDHMLEIEWTASSGWSTPKITPYHNLSLDPSTIVFHYAFELFEGMKAYRDSNGDIRTFRGDKNMIRMNKSAERIALPTFDGEELLKCIDKFLLVDRDFVPEGNGYSLYLRPTMIGTTASLGVGVPDKALLYVIASPVGPYYSSGFKPVSLEATDYAVRAWPGGVGDKKLGANYAPCVKPQLEAASRGYAQNLWLFGEEGYITEVGTMNVFFVFKNQDGKRELVTAPLDGTILEGVTRDSILELAKDRLDSAEWTISERKYTIGEVEERANKGELVEAFGAGTAAIVSPIKSIGFRDGRNIEVPVALGNSGELTSQVAEWIRKIQYGEESYKNWSRVAK